ncbi:MAG: transglycosylase domain-containing protein [Erysipelotrichales bacterium]|nr:transglycosylase domain-containing protein [Erysipelotrichales bacterium]
MKKIIKIIFTVSSIFTIVSTIFTIGYVFYSLDGVKLNEISKLKNESYSKIYDHNRSVVEVIGKDKKEYVDYEDIPPLLINALVSIEDKNFFTHPGIDPKRTVEAFVHNMFSSNKHGGSTITQQLVKNIMLTNEQTYKRKIQEAYLAFQLEQQFSKEDIITLYFNSIYFEQTTPGVVYASRRYFNKELNQLTLPEIAILAGVVKSASYYNPLKYFDRIDNRKNLVLANMLEDGYISNAEYSAAIKISTESLICKNENTLKDHYRFQAYLDIVYLEVEELIGKNPLVDKLEIYTYLDTSIQTYLDDIQEGKVINFTDESQQIASTIIKNSDSSIVGVIGGRNYHGSRLYNRAYSMQRQPASTMKPIFEYALAYEYLNYTNATSVLDAPYTYPNSTSTVQNADKVYLGNITVQDALGYSKNTAALYTLENVAHKIGIKECEKYLNEIGIMDDGPFTYAYGIGGMTYGVSTTQLSGAYSMLIDNGKYLKPSTISMIKDATTGEILYQRNLQKKQLISEQAAYKVSSTLVNIVNENYYNIGVVKVNGIEIGAKTGTNGYDDAQARALGYPSYADKDSWLAGFSSEYTMTVWSGWDIPKQGEKNYFGKGDSRRQIPKQIFKTVMEKINLKNQKRETPTGIVRVNVVKGTNGYYLANNLIPNSYIINGIFTVNDVPTDTLPMPILSGITDVKTYIMDNEIYLDILRDSDPILPFDYTKIFGQIGYKIKIKEFESDYESLFFTQNNIQLSYKFENIEFLSIIPAYEKSSLAFSSEFRII